MANVTYLLGAGASAEALPIYSNFKARFDSFSNFLLSHPAFPSDYNTSAAKLRKIINSVSDELQYHSTPDTIAKKYFHNDQNVELSNLKIVLILFFLYEQTATNTTISQESPSKSIAEKYPPLDKRYDSFISRLLLPKRGSHILPKGFNIITWNYDYQFELCAKLFRPSKPILNQEGFFTSLPYLNKAENIYEHNQFTVVHMNGVAMFHGDDESPISSLLGKFTNTKESLKLNLIKAFNYLTTKPEEHPISIDEILTFGWERLNPLGEPDEQWLTYKVAKEIISKTNILIIIGYSFPSFNSLIDKMMFAAAVNLHHIFIQDSDFDRINNLLDEYVSLLPKENPFLLQTSNVGYTNPFFVPGSNINPERKPQIKMI